MYQIQVFKQIFILKNIIKRFKKIFFRNVFENASQTLAPFSFPAFIISNKNI